MRLLVHSDALLPTILFPKAKLTTSTIFKENGRIPLMVFHS